MVREGTILQTMLDIDPRVAGGERMKDKDRQMHDWDVALIHSLHVAHS